MRFYLPVPMFDNPKFKELYNKLPSTIVRDLTNHLKHNHTVCCSRDSSTEFSHNRFIQWKFFKTGLYNSSNPLYIWKKDKKVHVSMYEGGMEKVRLLDVNLSATEESHIQALFYIIEFSYWVDSAAQIILPWIVNQYPTLTRLGMRVIRLPEFTRYSTIVQGYPTIPSSRALLLLGISSDGAIKRDGGSIKHKYFIWNGANTDVYNSLLYIKDNYLNNTQMISILSSNANTYNVEIDAILTRVDAHRKESAHKQSEERVPDATQPTFPSISDSPMEIADKPSVETSVKTFNKSSVGSSSIESSAGCLGETSQPNDQSNIYLLTPEEIDRLYGRQALKDYYRQIMEYLMNQ